MSDDSAISRIEHIDPGALRRIKGLRLVAAYGIAIALGSFPAISHRFPGGSSLGALAGGFALWASVSEGQTKRAWSIRDLTLLAAAASLGAALTIDLAPVLSGHGYPGPELTLVIGAFLVGYLKRFGILGAGIGSQIYIGQLLAYTGRLIQSDLEMVGVASVIAAIAAIIPRIVAARYEQPLPSATHSAMPVQSNRSLELRMGLQAAIAALVIVILNDAIGLEESAWAITACTYVISGSTSGTLDRVRRRVVGTVIGVPLGLAWLPVAIHEPLFAWIAAALAMIIYSMALPERYDIACGAYAFTLIVTLAISGETSIFVLSARAWETLIGGALGLATALLIFPLRPVSE